VASTLLRPDSRFQLLQIMGSQIMGSGLNYKFLQRRIWSGFGNKKSDGMQNGKTLTLKVVQFRGRSPLLSKIET